MKRVSLLLLPIALSANSAFAIQPGLGVSIKSNDSNVYVPINFGAHFRLEPYLGYSKYESSENKNTSTSRETEIGVGAFGISKAINNTSIYYGARISRLESTRHSTYTDSSSYSDSEYSSTTKQTLDGYAIAPVLGFEYFVTPQFTLGAEASWIFSDLDGKYKRTSSYSYGEDTAPLDIDTKQNSTSTRMLARYYFR